MTSLVQIRLRLLQQLRAAQPVPLPLTTLHEGLRLDGHFISRSQLKQQLTYLQDRMYILVTQHALHHGFNLYRLSPDGADFLDTQEGQEQSPDRADAVASEG